MAKEITGHECVNNIFHYSGNMKNLIKCRAYSLYEMTKRKEIIVESIVGNGKKHAILGDVLAKSINVDQGKCFSINFTQGDLKDCYAVGGNCNICNYIKGTIDRKEMIKQKEAAVEEKLKRLRGWISSDKEHRSMTEYKILTNQLQAEAENLQDAYIGVFREEN
ncbi:hypothetical protein FRZ06_11310 [Anoxybacterium hadale]|uniref:Uncharacterized protein n=1 Tax=Anoxybacterium hadale TaxID=3408580 RepID=A0ACD1ABC8_9FIRM|nr:hypothetical protein FRZ06_11310 [Clostridiales bacterium]